jgi:transposase
MQVGGQAMEHYVGIDVSLELSSVCVVDAKGKIVREAKVTSDPDALIVFVRGLDLSIERVGLEAGPLSQWLHAGLIEAASRRFSWRPGTSRPLCRR